MSRRCAQAASKATAQQFFAQRKRDCHRHFQTLAARGWNPSVFGHGPEGVTTLTGRRPPWPVLVIGVVRVVAARISPAGVNAR
jgi:hypothetical protein